MNNSEMSNLDKLTAEDLREKLLEAQNRLVELEMENVELRRLKTLQPGKKDHRFHTLVEHAREGISLVDEQGYVIIWNTANARLTGLSKEDALGKLIWDVQFQLLPLEQPTPQVYDRIKTMLIHFLDTGRASWAENLIEEEYLHPDGTRIFVESLVYAIKTNQGYMLASICQDISDRKRMESALKASEEQFRASVESLLDGFAILSAMRNDVNQIVNFRYEYINEVGCHLNQRCREEHINHTLLELLPDYKDNGIFDQYVRVVETGEPLITESLFYEDLYGDQQRLTLEFDFQVVKFGDGLILTWRDISRRVKNQRDILEAEELARSILDGLSAHIAILDQEGTILAVNQAWRDFTEANGGEDSKVNEGANYFVASDRATGLHSGEGKPFANGIRAVLSGKLDKFEMEYPYHSRDRVRWFIGRVTRFPSSDPPRVVIAHEDISERKRSEEELRLAHSQLTTLLEISQTVVSTLDLEPLLNLILQKLASVVRYSGVAIMPLEKNVLTIQAYRGPKLPVADEFIRIPIARNSELGHLILQRQPFFIRDINDYPRVLSEINTALGQSGRTLSRFRSWLVVPLMVKDVQIGIMVLTHHKVNYYNRSARDMAQMFANQATIAIQNAQLYREAQTSAVLEERNRLARELHDSVAQALYSISLYVNATRKALSANKIDVVNSHLEELQRTAGDAVADMRLLIYELRPPILEDKGLVEAIRVRLESVEARSGIQVNLEVDGELELPKTLETEVYRVIQEALNNILKHANATYVFVKIIEDQNHLYVAIQDNGKGFDQTLTEKSGGYGFRNIHERIRRIGGTLHIDTAPGQGTSIHIEIRAKPK